MFEVNKQEPEPFFYCFENPYQGKTRKPDGREKVGPT